MSGIEFGEKLKEIRKKVGVSSKNLSQRVNKAVTYVSQLERGLIKNPDYFTCKEILRELGFSEKGADRFLESYSILSPEQEKIEQQLILKAIEQEEEKINSGYYEKVINEKIDKQQSVKNLFYRIICCNEVILDDFLLDDLEKTFTVTLERGEEINLLENISRYFLNNTEENFTTDTIDKKEHD
jgi:transcriptional regulator with XRE-family HTH domain